jgi:hypothetical protein
VTIVIVGIVVIEVQTAEANPVLVKDGIMTESFSALFQTQRLIDIAIAIKEAFIPEATILCQPSVLTDIPLESTATALVSHRAE